MNHYFGLRIPSKITYKIIFRLNILIELFTITVRTMGKINNVYYYNLEESHTSSFDKTNGSIVDFFVIIVKIPIKSSYSPKSKILL